MCIILHSIADSSTLLSNHLSTVSLESTRFFQLTTNSDFFALAGGDAVDIRKHPELFPRLEEELEDVA